MARIGWSDLPIGPLVVGMLLVAVLVTFIVAFSIAGDGGGVEVIPTPTGGVPIASPTSPAASPTPMVMPTTGAASPTATVASTVAATAMPSP